MLLRKNYNSIVLSQKYVLCWCFEILHKVICSMYALDTHTFVFCFIVVSLSDTMITNSPLHFYAWIKYSLPWSYSWKASLLIMFALQWFRGQFDCWSWIHVFIYAIANNRKFNLSYCVITLQLIQLQITELILIYCVIKM